MPSPDRRTDGPRSSVAHHQYLVQLISDASQALHTNDHSELRFQLARR
jgi:hypothetical protein